MSLLEIQDYRLAFDTFDGTLHVLDGIDLALGAGETLGIVGETGCGKSVLARSLLRLNEAPPARVVSGHIRFEGEDVLALPEQAVMVVSAAVWRGCSVLAAAAGHDRSTHRSSWSHPCPPTQA